MYLYDLDTESTFEDTSLLFSEDTRTVEEQTSSTAQPNHVEWWEKKKENVNDNTQKPVHSPTIPTLRFVFACLSFLN